MAGALLIPLLLGVLSILQAGLNRLISENLGLAGATVLNNFVLLLSSLVFYLLVRGEWILLPEVLRGKSGSPEFSLAYLIPGMLGLGLVAGIPYAIARLGSVQVFLPLIAAQIVGSIAWDFTVEHRAIGLLRATGALVTLVGTVLVSLG